MNGLKVIRLLCASNLIVQKIESMFEQSPMIHQIRELIIDNSTNIQVQREAKLLIKNYKKHGTMSLPEELLEFDEMYDMPKETTAQR